jgi:hypothetical protein
MHWTGRCPARDPSRQCVRGCKPQARSPLALVALHKPQRRRFRGFGRHYAVPSQHVEHCALDPGLPAGNSLFVLEKIADGRVAIRAPRSRRHCGMVDGRRVEAPGRCLRRPQGRSGSCPCSKMHERDLRAVRAPPNLLRKSVIAVGKRPRRGQGAGQGHLDCEGHAATTEARRRSSAGLPPANDLLIIAA